MTVRLLAMSLLLMGAACSSPTPDEAAGNAAAVAREPGDPTAPEGRRYLSQPLVSEIFTADPSAHVWDDGRIYIYASHDIDTGLESDDLGNQYGMRDYRVMRMDRVGAPVEIGPVALDVGDVPWASQQMWAPDAAYRDGTYYLYFPARDRTRDRNGLGKFMIGVATSTGPMGPFTPEPEPIEGAFSMDPAVFTDDDGQSYLFFGGIWGGQLQRWANGRYDPQGSDTDLGQDDRPALSAKVARLNPDMKTLAEPARDALIVDAEGNPILGGDHARRFFEGAWMFKREGRYYFTYSTGNTHFIAYAIGDNPRGPFTYQGNILNPVQGWTNHHSVVEHEGRWWLFYHDTQLSGRNHLRNVKVTELRFNADGTIPTIDPILD